MRASTYIAALLALATLTSGLAIAKARKTDAVYLVVAVETNGRVQHWVVDGYTRSSCTAAVEGMKVQPARNVVADILAYCTDKDPR